MRKKLGTNKGENGLEKVDRNPKYSPQSANYSVQLANYSPKNPKQITYQIEKKKPSKIRGKFAQLEKVKKMRIP